jgi:hypothetical protein
MEDEVTKLDTFSLKQKSFWYFYKSQQFLYGYWLSIKRTLVWFVDSPYFYLLLFSIVLVLVRKSIMYFDVTLASKDLISLGFSIAGIIGASIAIIFSFSTFILQSTADLFSTQYLNKFIQDRKEKYIFWVLVALTVCSFLIPIFTKQFALEILLAILLIAFLFIYSLYKELRKRINPETTLDRIKRDAISQLNNSHNILKKHAHFQDRIFEHEESHKGLSLAVQYKLNPNWNVLPLENIKYLYEIGLRLLSKNEINSFNLTLKYIHDVYLGHLSIRNGHIILVPSGLWGTYTFEDEGFTNKVLEYLESMSNRLIQEKRKENIYFLLNIYESLISSLLSFKYADSNIATGKENPILNLVLGYYLGLISKLVQTKDRDWLWESIKSISKTSNTLLNTDYSHFNHNQINTALDEITINCISSEGQESFLKEVVNISFNQIRIGWNKYPNNDIFWKDVFKSLKKNTFALALSPGINMPVSETYIDFHSWQVGVINEIFEVKDKEQQEKLSDAYIDLLERWSDFLLDMARDIGLENKEIGLPIIQSVGNNSRIVYGIQGRLDKDLKKIYKAQFNILSWYFQKTEKVESSFLFNLDQVQEFLLNEINSNLKEQIDSTDIIKLYIRLVQQHFDKVSVGYGYNHPRVIEKLIHLGLVLTKHDKSTTAITSLIEDLNKKYLELNKEHFELEKKTPSFMGSDEYQLCQEIDDLKKDILSHNGGMVMGTRELLRTEITQEIWERFISQIKYCEGVEYTTVSYF